MAVTKEKKIQILANLEEEFKNSNSVAFSAYRGSTVADLMELRRMLREAGVSFVVAKKTLIKLAAKNAGLKEIPEESLEGPVAAVFSHDDELAGFQLLKKFGKKNEAIELLSGIFDGEVLDKAKVEALASLPGKQALIGQLVGLLAAPLRGIAGVGHSVVAGFVRALSEVQKKKASEALS